MAHARQLAWCHGIRVCITRYAAGAAAAAGVGRAPLVIGALGEAVPLVPNTMGSAWSSAPDDAAAPAEWLLFLERDAQAAARLAAAMTTWTAGDGRLANWALNVKSTRDVAHEIPMPPQGRVRLDPSLRWLLLPEYFMPYPLPYTSQMLVRLPAQQVPPGFVPTHVSEAMEAWAIRRVHMHCLIERNGRSGSGRTCRTSRWRRLPASRSAPGCEARRKGRAGFTWAQVRSSVSRTSTAWATGWRMLLCNRQMRRDALLSSTGRSASVRSSPRRT